MSPRWEDALDWATMTTDPVAMWCVWIGSVSKKVIVIAGRKAAYEFVEKGVRQE